MIENTDATALRELREHFGLSRADVTKATGLSDSVVWRSEQPHRKITDEQHKQLSEFYADLEKNGVSEKKQNGSKQKKQSVTAFLLTDAAAMFLDELDKFITERVTTAREKKRATSDLLAVRQKITEFRQETK